MRLNTFVAMTHIVEEEDEEFEYIMQDHEEYMIPVDEFLEEVLDKELAAALKASDVSDVILIRGW